MDEHLGNLFEEPALDPFVVLKKWQINLCDGSIVAAAILNLFISFHKARLKQKLEEPDISLIQYHSDSTIQNYLLGLTHSHNTTKCAIDLLLKKGFLQDCPRKSPFDSTKGYLLQVDTIRIRLREAIEPSNLTARCVKSDAHNSMFKDEEKDISEEDKSSSSTSFSSPLSAEQGSAQMQTPEEQDDTEEEITIRRVTTPPVEEEPSAPEELSSSVKEVIDYWQRLGLHIPKESSKAYTSCIKAIKRLLYSKKPYEMFLDTGAEFRRFSVEEIKKAIWNFHLAAVDPRYKPEIKNGFNKLPFHLFVHNPFGAKRTSYFLHYLNNEPDLIYIDNHPQTTNRLIQLYKRRIRCDNDAQISSSDLKLFERASKRVHEYIESRKGKITFGYNPQSSKDAMIADWLFDAVYETNRNRFEMISPSWFGSDITINDTFPKYLNKQALSRT